MVYFLQGLTVGLAYVAPIGMQNLFMINYSLGNSLKKALLAAGIVVFFDISLLLACFFGVGTLLRTFPFLQLAVLLLGGALVTYIGITLLRSKVSSEEGVGQDYSWRKIASTAFVVTWCNPQAIIDGSVMMGSIQATIPQAFAVYFLLGAMCASCLWFNSLAIAVAVCRSRINNQVLRYINIVCGAVIVLYGLHLLREFARSIF